MAKLHINGRLLHFPGPWGVQVPARGWSVKVTDIDLPGRGNDVIWSGTTDDSGNFSGTSEEWQDKVKTTVPYFDPLPFPGKWKEKVIEFLDPTDICMLMLEISHGSQSYSAIPFENGGPLPVFVPGPPDSPISTNQRALIVVTHLADEGDKNWQLLYKGLDKLCPEVAKTLLGSVYGRHTFLTGTDATRGRFLDAIAEHTAGGDVSAIDVILNLHGNPGTLSFMDGKVSSETLRDEILARNLQRKLRMLYSTACYGASHAPAMLTAGFEAAIGAVGVNAASATEYPALLRLWAKGVNLCEALKVADNPVTRAAADAVARSSFPDADSTKKLFGQSDLAIYAAPHDSGLLARSGAPILALHSGKALDIWRGGKTDGTPLVQWALHGGENQLFAAEPLGDGTFRLVATHSGLVLDVAGASRDQGAQVVQWTWNGGDNQRFRIERQPEGFYRIVAKHSGLVLDVPGDADGAVLQQWPWYGGNNQKFYVLACGVSFEAVHSGKVLDVNGAGLDARLIQYDRHGDGNQRFRCEALNDGTYRLIAEHSGMVLDVSGASRDPGARLVQHTWHGGDNQRFRIEPLGDGTYRIVAKHSGLPLDVYAGSKDNHAEIQQWTWHGGPNQRFRIR